jgi:hypothetical protein
MRSIQEVSDGAERLTEAQVKSGIRLYSTRYFLPELRDELHGYLNAGEIDHVVALLSSLDSDRFTLEELRARATEFGFTDLDLNNVVRTLFECGGLGMVQQGDGRPHYTFKYRNRNAIAIPTSRWVIHLGALKALNIRRR